MPVRRTPVDVRARVLAVTRVVVGTAGAAALLAACSEPPPPGDPVVLVSGSGDGYGMSAEVGGQVSVDVQGCVRVGGRLAVWPGGTSWDHDGDGLRLPGGQLVPRGGSVTGGGGETTGAVARTYLADPQAGEACAWESTVVLFVPGSDVDPS